MVPRHHELARWLFPNAYFHCKSQESGANHQHHTTCDHTTSQKLSTVAHNASHDIHLTMSSRKLTDHLLSTSTNPTYDEATRHPFLTEAGSGSLPLPRLALWLSQDRIYAAHAYPRFIGALISRIPFHQADAITSPREQQNQKILQALVKCLNNVVREVDFFQDTSETFGISMEGWIERKGTRDYTAEMSRVASSGLFEGLVFLWAMERVWSLLAELFSILIVLTFLECVIGLLRCVESCKEMPRHLVKIV